MEFNPYHKCKVKIKVNIGQEENIKRKCGETVKVSKYSSWNLKRQIARKHKDVLRKHGNNASKGKLVIR